MDEEHDEDYDCEEELEMTGTMLTITTQGIARSTYLGLQALADAYIHAEVDTPDYPSPEALQQVYHFLETLGGGFQGEVVIPNQRGGGW